MPSDEPVQLTVNGQPVQAPAGTRLLDLLRSLEVRVPTLCHDPRLTPYGGCRLCVVARRDGRGGLIPACSTPVLPGMSIETDTPEVVESRRQQLALLVLNHRLECPACEQRGDCRFQELLYEYGVPDRRLPFERILAPRDESSPVIVRDQEKCILCGKCVRLCEEVQGVAAIALVHRGLNARVATMQDRPLDCEFCGQCVNACPVGALVARPFVSDVPAWLRSTTATTCSFCSCGCQIQVETHDGALVRVTSDVAVAPNHGKLCVKGWLGLDVLASDERLRRPLVKRDGQLVECTWDEALTAAAKALGDAAAAGLPVAGIAGARLTSEDALLMNRLLRGSSPAAVVRVGPVGGAAALEAMRLMTGAARSTATFDDLRAADVVLVLRADPSRTHPMVKTDLVQGIKQRGQKLVLAHGLSGGLDRHATVYVPLVPGGEETFLHTLSARLLALEPQAEDALRPVAGFREWRASLSAYEAFLDGKWLGGDASGNGAVERAVELLRQATKVVTVVVTGQGIPGDEAAVTRAAAALDALLHTRGGGVLVLAEKVNVQGLLDAGLDARPAGVSGTPSAVVYVAADDPIGAWPGGAAASEIVRRAAYVIVQDAFLTETARAADVVLPVAILAERNGTVTGADGVLRPLRRVVPPPAGVPQDGEIFAEIGRRLGAGMPAAAAIPGYMAKDAASAGRRGGLRELVPAGAPLAGGHTGMLLDSSPQLFRSGSTTERSRLLQELAPSIALRVSPADASSFGIENGEPVRLSAGRREALLRARIDETVRPGAVVAHWRVGRELASPELPDTAAVTVDIRRSQ
jgi:predicted molibdopterin-dependent oxidoreductase YjgC